MILEIAVLYVVAGKEEAFEADFKIASQYIAAIDGYVNHRLLHCLTVENKYVLHVTWESVAAHEIGFRQSAGYQAWKKLLHAYYDPFPVVEHFTEVFSQAKPAVTI